MHISGVFFDSEIVYQNLYKPWESFMNTKKVFKDISKLIELLDRKKKSFGHSRQYGAKLGNKLGRGRALVTAEKMTQNLTLSY